MAKVSKALAIDTALAIVASDVLDVTANTTNVLDTLAGAQAIEDATSATEEALIAEEPESNPNDAIIAVELPIGSRVTSQTVISKIVKGHPIWAKERWFAKALLAGWSKSNGVLTVNIRAGDMLYRGMVQE